MRKRARQGLLFGVLVPMVLAVACGGASTPEPTVTPSPTITATPEPTSTPRPTNTPNPTHTPAPVMLSEEEVAAVVLGLDDLTTGFTVDPILTGPLTYDSLIEQGYTITADYLQSAGRFRGYCAAYERRTTLENTAFVTSWAISFEDVDLASGYLADFPMFFPGATMQPMSFSPRGEESVGYKMTGPPSVEGFEFDGYAVIMRQRNVVAVVQYIALLGYADLQEFEQYTGAQEARLRDMVQGDQSGAMAGPATICATLACSVL